MAAAIAFPAPPDHAEVAGAGWQQLEEVPCRLVAEIPVRGFTVGDLLLLRAGSVVNSKQLTREKVGLRANGSLIASAEFEVMNGRLAVRLADLD